MNNHHDAINPAPANVAELVESDLVAAGLAEYLEQIDPPLFGLLMAKQLSWTLQGFDGAGVATVDIVAKQTGELVAGARVHWTLICRPAVPDDLSELDNEIR